MNKREKITKLCNMICALLMAALIVMQFVPFWYSVGGEHMTEEEYLAWSKEYVPVAERPTESKAPTEATTAPVETTAVPTETTAAPTETTADPTGETTAPSEETTAPVEETTAPVEDSTEPSESVPEETKKAGKDPFKHIKEQNEIKNQGKDQAVKPPMPTEIPTDPEVKTMSIAQSVWRTNRYKTDMAAPLLMFHVAVLGLGIVGIFFCLIKRKANLNCVWVLIISILSVVGYFTNPAAQTGMNWIIHGVLAALLLIPGLIMLAFFIKDAINWFTKIEE